MNQGIFVRFDADTLARLRADAGAYSSVPRLIRQLVHERYGLPLNEAPSGPAGATLRAAELAAEGRTLKQIGVVLEAEGFTTPRGLKRWDATQVRRLLRRLERV